MIRVTPVLRVKKVNKESKVLKAPKVKKVTPELRANKEFKVFRAMLELVYLKP